MGTHKIGFKDMNEEKVDIILYKDSHEMFGELNVFYKSSSHTSFRIQGKGVDTSTKNSLNSSCKVFG